MDYSYCGLTVNEEDFRQLKSWSDKGYCPFCKSPFKKAYGSLRKHIKSCQHLSKNNYKKTAAED